MVRCARWYSAMDGPPQRLQTERLWCVFGRWRRSGRQAARATVLVSGVARSASGVRSAGMERFRRDAQGGCNMCSSRRGDWHRGRRWMRAEPVELELQLTSAV